MNPAQKRLAKTLAARARKAKKNAQTGTRPVPAPGSGGRLRPRLLLLYLRLLFPRRRRGLDLGGALTLLERREKGIMIYLPAG